MRGTSTDLSRYDGEYEHVFKSTTAGVTIQAPQLDIDTVAARSGLCNFSGWVSLSSALVLPESVGAHPGPTCYRKGIP
ncbi:unnamed protein product [Clavelina lepadiformis]|uniref:Hydantoinase A/oxoprolinase domain-containing protein n=1 Tax=Clavelina lepadiformis TaxID=159417 RepID=A0ABP0G7Q1_CLALP